MAYVQVSPYGGWFDVFQRALPAKPKPSLWSTFMPPAGAAPPPASGGGIWNRFSKPQPVTIPAGPKPKFSPNVRWIQPPVSNRSMSGFGDFGGGFSLSKLTNWVSGTAAAISKKDWGAVAGQVAQAIPGTPAAKSVPVVAPQKPVTPGLFSPGGFVEKNQTVLLLAAAGLAAFLVLGRRSKGRR